MPLSVQATHVVMVQVFDPERADGINTFCFYAGSPVMAEALTITLRQLNSNSPFRVVIEDARSGRLEKTYAVKGVEWGAL